MSCARLRGLQSKGERETNDSPFVEQTKKHFDDNHISLPLPGSERLLNAAQPSPPTADRCAREPDTRTLSAFVRSHLPILFTLNSSPFRPHLKSDRMTEMRYTLARGGKSENDVTVCCSGQRVSAPAVGQSIISYRQSAALDAEMSIW